MKLTNENIRRPLGGYFHDIEGQKVYHIEAELGNYNVPLLTTLFYKAYDNRAVELPYACIRNPHFMGTAYTEHSEDSYAVSIYQPKGTFHVLSNDIVYAWQAFIDNLFPVRRDFEQLMGELNVSSDWTNNKEALNIFSEFVSPYIVERDYSDDDE